MTPIQFQNGSQLSGISINCLECWESTPVNDETIHVAKWKSVATIDIEQECSKCHLPLFWHGRVRQTNDGSFQLEAEGRVWKQDRTLWQRIRRWLHRRDQSFIKTKP